MMNRETTLRKLGDGGVIAVIRAPEPARVRPLVEALLAGGVVGIEVTTSTPGAVGVVEQLAGALGDQICLGAGTILDAATAAAMIRAGARYIVSPILDEAIITVTRKLGALSVPAGYTPTEIFRAFSMGADVVKVFPATTLGPSYLRDLLAVMPWLKLIPTGGVEVKNTGDFIRAGAWAVGAGSALVSKAALAAGDYETIRRTAAEFVVAVQSARKK